MSEHAQQQPAEPRFGKWMGAMWLYTVLRFGLFFALWGVLALCGVRGLIGAAVALVISVPLSFVLLAKPRQRFAEQLEARVAARRTGRAQLDAELDPDAAPRDE
jgi:O-antigen ligase